MVPTGYEPLNTLKPVAEGLWIVDGPAIKSCGFPFSTRATVAQLENGDIWVHSPTQLTDSLCAELDALGPVRHLIAPNQFHYVNIADWCNAYPEATFWAAPGVHDRAAKNGLSLPESTALRSNAPEEAWKGQIDQLIVRGSRWHKEVVFFHRAGETLVLTDLIEAFETEKLPAHCRPFAWLNGIDDSDGKTPPLIAWSFRDKDAFAEDIEQMIEWRPRRVIIAHGRWYERDGVGELERAFRRILRARRWDSAIKDMKDRENAQR